MMDWSIKTQRITIILFSLTILFIVIGTISISRGLSSKLTISTEVSEKVINWHNQISMELPASQSDSWNKVGYNSPIQLLRACATEYKIAED